ncbi:metal-dependent hydrolase [Halovenus rubra]|uniref:Metal-dependent hydrolase n=2 Tax=Halovenus rubra TaxID=869890 RepID=A0ABD5XES2_9EURY|nr:metal-dependent hydrolase [Halovenus rubra]
MGHVAVAYLLYVGSTRIRSVGRPPAWPAVALCIGSQIPDLIDKPLGWYTGVLPTGRSLAHSLLFVVPLCLLVMGVLSLRDRSEYGVAFAVGAISHSLADSIPVLWSSDATASFLLWPYLSVEPYEGSAPSPVEMLLSTLTEPYFLSQFVLFAVAVMVWRADGYPGLSLLQQALPTNRYLQTS